MTRKPASMALACLCAVLFASAQVRSEEPSTPTSDAQEPFSIKDERLSPDSSAPDPCRTDAEIWSSSSQGYETSGTVEMSNSQFYMWCNQAKHTWIGRHENIRGAIPVIDSSKDDPLQFKVDKEKGYVYQKGTGTVTLLDKRVIELPIKPDSAHPRASGSALPGFAGDWEGRSNWPGILFTIAFSVPENSDVISGLKVAAECTEGVGKISFAFTEPVKMQADRSFSAASQGSTATGRLASEDSAEGTYKAPFSMKCGEKFVEVSGKWSATKKK